MAPDDFLKPGKVERSVAWTEICALIHRYGALAKEHTDWDQMARCYHTDGVMHLPDGSTISPANFSQIVKGEAADYVRHHLTTMDVQFVNSMEARVNTNFFTMTSWETFDHWGVWKDVVTRKAGDGEWLIADRKVVIEHAASGGWFASKYETAAKDA